MTRLMFIIFLLFSHASYAEVVEGFMTCIIKSQKITQIKDGKANVYNGYKNDPLQVGASLKLEYKFYPNGNEVYFKMSNKKRTFLYNEGKLVQDTKVNERGMIFLVLESYGIIDKIRLTKNFIIFRDNHMFNRYFKDDWMGITTGTTRTDNAINNVTVSWDCKHSNNSTLSDLYVSLSRHIRGVN